MTNYFFKEHLTHIKLDFEVIGLLMAKLLRLIVLRVYPKILASCVRGVLNFFQHILLNRGMHGEKFCRIILSRFGVS